MLRYQMCNISSFVRISPVLAQRSTAPNRLLLSSRPGKGPVVWHPSKLPSSQMDTFSRTARRHTRVDYLKKENVGFIVLDMWPQTTLILIQWLCSLGCPSATSLLQTKI